MKNPDGSVTHGTNLESNANYDFNPITDIFSSSYFII